MLEIKVSVTIEGLSDLADAIKALAGARVREGFAEVAPVAQTVTEQAEEPKRGRKKAAKADAPAPVEPTPEIEVVLEKPVPEVEKPATDPDVAKSNAAKLYQLSEAGASLLEAGKMQDLIALLHSFKVEAVTMLQPDQYDAFAQGLRGLGAQI